MARLRFSLLTLLLVVLEIASITLLIRNAPAWRARELSSVKYDNKHVIVTKSGADYNFESLDGVALGTVSFLAGSLEGVGRKDGRAVVFRNPDSNVLEVYDLATKQWARHTLPIAECNRVMVGVDDWVFAANSGVSKVCVLNLVNGKSVLLEKGDIFDSERALHYRAIPEGLEIHSPETGERRTYTLPTGNLAGSRPSQFAWLCKQESTVWIVNSETRETLLRIPVPPNLSLIATFSPDDSHVALWDLDSTSEKSKAQVWDIKSSVIRQEFTWSSRSTGEDWIRFKADSLTLVLMTENLERVALYRGANEPFRVHQNVCYNVSVPDIVIELDTNTLVDTEDGTELFDFHNYESLWIKTRDHIRAKKENQDYMLYRVRPEAWWGLAWLPEFWLAAIITALLLWNLRAIPRTSPTLLCAGGSLALLAVYVLLFHTEEVVLKSLPTNNVTIYFKRTLWGDGEIWLRKGSYIAKICKYRPKSAQELVQIHPVDIFDERNRVFVLIRGPKNTRSTNYFITELDSEKPRVESTLSEPPTVIAD